MIYKYLLFVCLFSNVLFAEYHGQYNQDQYLNEHIFNWKRNGVFIDVGANEPIHSSNTYFFENELEWKGICIEPMPELFKKLVQERTRSICLQTCISSIQGEAEFLQCYGYTNTLSGLINSYDPKHLQRIENEINWYGGGKEIVKIKTQRLEDIFDEYNITHVDLLSIDTEGSEEDIIHSINFNKVFIDVIIVENNYQTNNIEAYLTTLGYKLVNKIAMQDDIFRKIK